MPNDKKERSTYTTAQFIDAYGKFVEALGGPEHVKVIMKSLSAGEDVTNPMYKRSVFNKIFMDIHNDDMRERYPSGTENKMIEGVEYVDNTKISQIFNYIKTQLSQEEKIDKASIMPLPSLTKGSKKRDWGMVANIMGLKTED